MGRGWKRARLLSTASVPYPTVAVQGIETESADQDVRRHHGQCLEDVNLDSTDRTVGGEVPPIAGEVSLEPVASDCSIETAAICLPGSVALAEVAF